MVWKGSGSRKRIPIVTQSRKKLLWAANTRKSHIRLASIWQSMWHQLRLQIRHIPARQCQRLRSYTHHHICPRTCLLPRLTQGASRDDAPIANTVGSVCHQKSNIFINGGILHTIIQNQALRPFLHGLLYAFFAGCPHITRHMTGKEQWLIPHLCGSMCGCYLQRTIRRPRERTSIPTGDNSHANMPGLKPLRQMQRHGCFACPSCHCITNAEYWHVGTIRRTSPLRPQPRTSSPAIRQRQQ